MGICTLYHGKILEVGHFCSYWLVLDRRRISLVAILLSPVNEAWYNRWSLDILLASNLCQLLHMHSTPDLSTLKCWNSKKSCAGVCRESAKYIQDLPVHRLLSLPSCRENFHSTSIVIQSREFFFLQKTISNRSRTISKHVEAKKMYLYMDVAPIFQNVLSLSQTWMFHCSNVSTVKQVQRVPFGWCYKSMQMFFALNIMLTIMDKSKPQCPKSLTHLCVFMLPNILS